MQKYLARAVNVAVVALCLAGSNCWAKVISVPGNQPTIQKGIDSASNGDIVEVSPGRYFENINFHGKLITVTSTGGAAVTTIDGGQNGPVATFSSGESTSAVLSGFTLTNGLNPEAGIGGGVTISGSSPTISENIISQNSGCGGGGGIGVSFGSPLIENNVISSNNIGNCVSDGAGIGIVGTSSAQLLSNYIANNFCTGNGGGIALNGSSPVIENNTIIGNIAVGLDESSFGGGIYIINQSSPAIIQNVIVNNITPQGGGIYFSIPSGSEPLLVNNTIADNMAYFSPQGSAVYADGFDAPAAFFNNLLIGFDGENAVFCDSTYDSTPPGFQNNDAFSPGGSAFEGSCAGEIGENGNISAAPQFVNASLNNFRLMVGSPGIDVGLNSAPQLPVTDFDGSARIADGTGDGKFVVDMGAYEFHPVTVSPTSLSFGMQLPGSRSVLGVTLTNLRKTPLSITRVSASGVFSASSSCPGSLPAGASCTIAVTFAPVSIGPAAGTLIVNDDDDNGPRMVELSGNASLATPTPSPTGTPTPAPTATPAPGQPIITLSPPVVFVGDSFKIQGSGFTAGSRVNFFVATANGSINAGPFVPTAFSDTALTVAVPDTVSLGQGFVSFQVVNTDEHFLKSNLGNALLQGAPAAGIPTITSINGLALSPTSSNPDYAVNNVETVVPPLGIVVLGGTGFDTANGVAVDLFCDCPGGKVGPFFVTTTGGGFFSDGGLFSTAVILDLPDLGFNFPPPGPGSFVVSNAGSDGKYSRKSNAVSVAIGARISVTSVKETAPVAGRTASITVTGTGFSTLTVINFFNRQGGRIINLGGFGPFGAPAIPISLVNDTTITFAVPFGAIPGPAYVQALNPPFVPFSSSGSGPGGAFTLH